MKSLKNTRFSHLIIIIMKLQSCIIEAVRNKCIKIEPDEYHPVDEQVIPSKTKYTGICQYNPKKAQKMGIQKLSTSRS